ncbi:MAG TPA: hypothetical protein VEQ85_02045, partial [Lacipirellulaceae bacterium]|nr:hypothetical protein [Lacipirellulaceae bacterium]
ECYRRLQAAGVEKLVGFNVPWLVGWDHELRVIEMTIVQAPYILDFGKVYIDAPPPYLYDKQMMKNVYAEWRDRYGSKWNEVVCAVEVLTKYGIFYVDPRRSNIDPGDEDEDPLPSDLAGYEDELAE